MAPRSISDTDLVDRLETVFRDVGYDGASLATIAEATGLQKSSLYNRFPGGKQQMAAEVAGSVGAQFATDILSPLTTDAPAADRIDGVAANLETFYRGGEHPCLLNMLSVGDAGTAARTNLRAGADHWISAFADVARAAGATRDDATARAQDAICAIEGALVLARVTGQTDAFHRALTRLPALLLGSSPS
ncbi:TetR/AcrR family transcriptional regulator [Williamsia phyllosphaerae]|uniref:TetR family transcriptional regulator n=1 Tax=Williamsia phyllosphaerae TaxID=885042 RepID=A0ABQ1UEX4_9NOCA|nr:TetR/AcrR family transcriptional regulator [Williamsia phyllosphaerae]GGF17526.1 TetR family transcriptional regulator [Williamsia phyllosphaerae]